MMAGCHFVQRVREPTPPIAGECRAPDLRCGPPASRAPRRPSDEAAIVPAEVGSSRAHTPPSRGCTGAPFVRAQLGAEAAACGVPRERASPPGALAEAHSNLIRALADRYQEQTVDPRDRTRRWWYRLPSAANVEDGHLVASFEPAPLASHNLLSLRNRFASSDRNVAALLVEHPHLHRIAHAHKTNIRERFA